MTNNKKNRLGNNPLDWIGKTHSTINETENKKTIDDKINKQPEVKEEKINEKRETFILKVDLSEKIKDYAYWERIKQKDAINKILEDFFKDKHIKKRPE